MLQCYDQPNEIYGELGLSFCCITHTLAAQKTHCGHIHSDGWMHLLMFQTTEHHSKPFFLFTCKHTGVLRILLIVPYAPSKEKNDMFFNEKEWSIFYYCFSLGALCGIPRWCFEFSSKCDEIILISHLRKAEIVFLLCSHIHTHVDKGALLSHNAFFFVPSPSTRR